MKTLRLCLMFCLLAGVAQAQTDPLAGTWKLNAARSTFPAGGGSTSETLTIVVNGDRETLTADGYLANGSRDQYGYTAGYDGKTYSSTTIITEERKASLRRIDARTLERVSKVDGHVVMKARRVVSADGRTLTTTVMAVDPDGKETLRQTGIFERTAPATGTDPFDGVWTLNIAKSTFLSPANAVKRETLAIRVTGDRAAHHVEALTPVDAVEVQDYTVKFDGNDYPNHVVTTTSQAFTLRKVDARTRERVTTREGKAVGISRRVVSPDGRTLTITLLAVDGQGTETVRQVRVFERQ